MKQDILVTHHDSFGWIVQRFGASNAPLAHFRRRAIAEAYGRAIAHRCQVELIVRRTDGKQVRYPASALSYATRLS